MEYPPTPQQVDPEFMAEAARAAAQINAQAAGGNVYGAPRTPSEVNELPHLTAEQNMVSESLGRVTGAAEVQGVNAYVDESQRGAIASRVAAEHAQKADMYDQFLRDLANDKEDEKVDA